MCDILPALKGGASHARTATRLVGCLQVCGPPSRLGLESPTATLSATGRPLALTRRGASRSHIRNRRFLRTLTRASLSFAHQNASRSEDGATPPVLLSSPRLVPSFRFQRNRNGVSADSELRESRAGARRLVFVPTRGTSRFRGGRTLEPPISGHWAPKGPYPSGRQDNVWGTSQKPSPRGVYGAYPRPEGRGFAPVQSHKTAYIFVFKYV